MSFPGAQTNQTSGFMAQPYQAPTASPTAGVTAGTGTLANQIPSLFNQAQNYATGAVNPAFGDAASLMMGAAGGTSGGLGPSLGYAPGWSGIQGYMNPYQSQVMDAASNDINRQLGMDLNNIQGDMAARNAFGARGDLEKSEARRNAMDALARTSANLGYSGFNTAGQFAQQDLARRLQASSGDLDREAMARRSDLDRMLAAGGGLGGLGNTAVSNMLAQSGQLSNLAGQGYNWYTGLNDTMSGYGQQQQDTQQQLINSALSGFNSFASYPWNVLSALNGSVPTNIQPSQSTVGSGDSGAGLLSSLGTLATGAASLIPLFG